METKEERILRTSPRVELAIAVMIHRGRRNASLVLAFMLSALVFFIGLNPWFYVAPGLLLVVAIVRQSNIILLNSELRRRS